MATDVIATLRAEIGGLQKKLDTRRRALTLLAGTAHKAKVAPSSRPTKASAARRPSRPPAKSLATRIQEYLAAHKAQKFAPAQIAAALRKGDKTVRRDNVQRRLSDMAKTRRVRRENGRYSAP